MTDNVKKVSQLPVTTGIQLTDKLVILAANVAGQGAAVVNTATISVNNFISNTLGFPVVLLGSPPANGGALTVVGGTIYTDGTRLYVATANNTLKKLQANTSTGDITLVSF